MFVNFITLEILLLKFNKNNCYIIVRKKLKERKKGKKDGITTTTTTTTSEHLQLEVAGADCTDEEETLLHGAVSLRSSELRPGHQLGVSG